MFNDDMVVPDDLPGIVQLLRCSKVRCRCISKVTGLHPLCIQDNSERGIGVNVTTISRELELAGGHVVDARNITHRCRVTRASLNLEAICDGLANTEVDEVVTADERIRFTSFPTGTIDLLKDRGVQSEGGLRVPVIIAAVLIVVCGGIIVTAVLVAGSVVLVVVTTVLVIIATVLVIIATFQTIVAAEFGVLAGNEGVRVRNEEGSRELDHSKENKRETEELHDSSHRWREGQSGRSGLGGNDGMGSKQASLSKVL